MNQFKKSLLTLTSVAFAMALNVGSAVAAYPDKPINVVVPYGPGGDSDLSTRVWADAVEKILGSPVVVINKTGGGGVVGTTFVANAPNDGYTLINAGLGNMQVSPFFSKTPYTFEDFEPVVKMSSVPLGIVVNADSPYKTFADFVAAAKAGSLTQGAWGASSSGAVLGNIIAEQAGYKVRYVHGNTTAESMVALLGGHIDSAVSFPPAFGPHVKSGKVRVLALNQKMAEYPDVPTFAELGIKGGFEGWAGIFAPKGIPPEVLAKLVEASTKAMSDPVVLKAYANMGANVDFRYGPEWVKDLKATNEIMKDAAAKAQKN